LNQELQVIVSRKQLNTLLGRDSGTPVNVAKNNDVLPLRWEYNDILELAQERNSGLKIAQQNKRVADRNASSTISSFLPRLSLNASYGYTDRTVSSDLPAFGSDVLTERTDATIGLLLSFNLFNGGRNRIDWQNTRLEARNRKLALEDARNQLQGYVQEAFETYNIQIQLVEIEEQNLLIARQNIELHQERYQLGTSSSLEFRDAQLSLIRAQTSLITSQFQARITALEIEQLIGNLQIE
ncbi:MAG: TolC family protein, partial [candidate division Zixibacteria bacterium]|nr:TolC family protein [candidate division Zixibacteria bacterium]